MPQLFRPYADTVARTVLVSLVVLPFVAIGLAYATMRSSYITDQSLTLEQPVPFSHGTPMNTNTRVPSVWDLAKGPLAVWAVLLVLLAVSAASAYLPLGPFNAALNLAVAAVMIFLLATFLMNLRLSSALVRVIAASGLLWLAFMFILTFTDYLSRT